MSESMTYASNTVLHIPASLRWQNMNRRHHGCAKMFERGSNGWNKASLEPCARSLATNQQSVWQQFCDGIWLTTSHKCWPKAVRLSCNFFTLCLVAHCHCSMVSRVVGYKKLLITTHSHFWLDHPICLLVDMYIIQRNNCTTGWWLLAIPELLVHQPTIPNVGEDNKCLKPPTIVHHKIS